MQQMRIARLLGNLGGRQPDIYQAGDWLVITPITHFLRGLWLQEFPATGDYAGFWGVRNLWGPEYYPELDGFMGTTNYISNPRSREFPNLPETEQLKLLSEEVERVTLPHLRSIDSMDRLYQLTMQQPPPFSEGYEAHFRLELAMGNFDRARALLNKHRGWWFDDDDLFDDDVPAYSEQTRQLCHLFEKEEFQRIAQLFHQWEAAAAKDYGVQHLWQPSPFPFELGRRG